MLDGRFAELPLEDGAVATLVPSWLSPDEADRTFSTLRDGLAWEQRRIRVLGREVLQPRLTAWYGDAAYTYSGVTLTPFPWTPLLAELRDRLARDTEQRFNSVLCNLYRDGQDSMGMHADKEPELGKNPVIASVSLGATRRFVLSHTKKKTSLAIPLTHGSLLVLSSTTQHHYRHGVPKTKAPTGARINLTFRRIVVE
jgi:alkylated DNA repair dioxygenase AlkB